MQNSSDNARQEWSTATGEVGRLVERLRHRRRRRTLAKAAGVVGLLLAVGMAGLLLPGRGGDLLAGLQCDLVQRRTADYLDGRLDEALRKRFEIHYANCPHCRRKLEQLRRERERRSAAFPWQSWLSAGR